MIPPEAEVPQPRTAAEKAQDSVVRLLGLTCSGCRWLRYGDNLPEAAGGSARDHLRDVYWCSRVTSLNRWREPRWPACWLRSDGRAP